MKKYISVFFILTLFMITLGSFFSIKSGFAFAEENKFKSKSAILLDYNSGTIIYKQNETKRQPIASMTKIMTLVLAFDAIMNNEISYDKEVIVSENASNMGGSQVFLEANAKYTVEQLIKSIVVASANDASVAIAETICGSEQAFVDNMNGMAKDLKMENTYFVNCTGLHCVGQYSCALDVAKMFSKLVSYSDYFKFSSIWMDEISHPKGRVTQISNTNKLIRFYDGCDCGKTGYTAEAGHCLAASSIKGNMRLISVVVSAPDSKTRFKEVSEMFNYGFNNYENKLVIDCNKPLDAKLKIKNCKVESLNNVCPEKSIYIFSRKNEKRAVEISYELNNQLKAPIKKGEILGKIYIYENGIEIDNTNIIASCDILAKNIFDIFKDISYNWSI